MELDTSIKILIAEDNPNLRQVLVNIIKKIGYDKILEAENGEIAWQFVQRGGVELVLTDCPQTWYLRRLFSPYAPRVFPGMSGRYLLGQV